MVAGHLYHISIDINDPHLPILVVTRHLDIISRAHRSTPDDPGSVHVSSVIYPLIMKTMLRTVTHEYDMPPPKAYQPLGDLLSKTIPALIRAEAENWFHRDDSQPHHESTQY